MRDSELQSIHVTDVVSEINVTTWNASDAIIVLGGSVSKKYKLEEHISTLSEKRIDVIHIQDIAKSGLVSRLGLPGLSIDHITHGRKILAVVPLVDSLVPKADYLNTLLNCPGNSPSTSFNRIDKYLMHACLKKQGLAYCESYRVSTIKDALSTWLNFFKGQPVVMKPPRSGGSDGVVLCRSKTDLIQYMRKYLNMVNLERNTNDDLIMQEYIKADYEYVVNTVSLNGHHIMTDIWIAPSKGSLFIYDYQELIVPDDIELAVLSEYTFKVLDACGILNGACHSELAHISSSKTFKLIEVNPRIAGEVRTSNNISNWNNHDQIYWLAVTIVCPLEFAKMKQTHMERKFNCLAVFLKSNTYGTLNVEAIVKLTQSLKSFHQFGRGLAALHTKKIPIVPTVDLITSPGVIMLVGPTAWDDYHTIRLKEPILYIPKEQFY